MAQAASGIFWMRRVRWRKSLIAAFMLTICAYASCLFSGSFLTMVILMLIAGCGNGIFYSIAFLSISDTQQTERNFGYCIVGGVALAAVGLYAFPLVNQQWGFVGVIGTLIAITSLVVIMLPWFPDHGTKGSQEVAGQGVGPVYPVFLGIGAMCVLYLGLSGIWAFVGKISEVAGIDATDAGISLALGMALGAVGALLASIIGNRFGNVKPMWLGTACIIAGIAFLVNIKGFLIYTVSVFLIQSGWNFALPYQLGAISSADKSGRFVPLIATAMGGGAAVGPGLAGMIILAKGYGALFVTCTAVITISAVAYTWLILFNTRNEITSNRRI